MTEPVSNTHAAKVGIAGARAVENNPTNPCQGSGAVADAEATAVGGVGGVGPSPKEAEPFAWAVESGAAQNYGLLGQRLAAGNQNLYRNRVRGQGLILILEDGTRRLIMNASQFAPVLVDSLPIMVVKEGKVVRELPTAAHLNAMLRSEAFLSQFKPVDQVIRAPLYAGDFSIVQPGYHAGGVGQNLLYLGPPPQVADSMEMIQQFLDVMDFATPADRTNALGAALTVQLRHHWLGEKPLVLITATKSQAGKGTTAEFIRGAVPRADILYENIDWPMMSQFQRQVSHDPEIGVVCLDNVRLDSSGGRERRIRSAWVESFVTTRDVMLASPGAGEPIRLRNTFVFIINTNDGSLSPDLLNRSLPIHLAPKGDVHDRTSPIGDPKLEFLPRNRERIEAELRGMVERWRKAGRPLDETAKHPMNLWAKTVGGILKANGFRDFLTNYQTCRVVEDIIRDALAILAGARPGEALRPREWSEIAVKEGLAKTLFRSHERDTEAGRERAIGVIFSKHQGETFNATTDSKRIRVRLEGGYRRWSRGKRPENRYRFTVTEESPRPVEA
jgi:hypothetical protein